MSNEAYLQFGQWLAKQPWWLQDATWRIYHNHVIDDKQIDQYVQMCISQGKGVDVPYKVMPDKDVIPDALKPKMHIKDITDIKNVNALADNASLTFSESGVSVVYGLNGAGKSGFMRIIKHVSGNPYAEPIQGNVYRKSGSEKPSCKFRIMVNESESTVDCDLSTECKDKNLRQCDVFDTRISGGYVTAANSVSYEPFVFSVLKELANIAGRIENAVQNKIESLFCESITIPQEFQEFEETKWLFTLKADTIVPDVFLSWTAEDNVRLLETDRLLNLEQVESRLKSANQQKDILERVQKDLSGIKEYYVAQKYDELKELYSDLNEKLVKFETAKKLFEQNASDQDKCSVSVEVWRNLWSLARQYYDMCLHRKIGKEFASEGSICPLCLQPIEGNELTRFASVDEYISGRCSSEFEQSQKHFADKYKESLNHTYTSSIIPDLLEDKIPEDTKTSIIDFYKLLDELENSENPVKTYPELDAIVDSKVFDNIDDEISKVGTEISRLMRILSEDNQIALREEKQLLTAREWVSNHIDKINDVISCEKVKNDLNNAQSYLNTNRITKESNTLADQLISEAYIERFANELKLLAPKLKVKIEKGQSTKGKSPYRVVLDTEDKMRKNPQYVLSEGEQRIVALAAFFADATGRNECTPIVIDDPISSLDNNYEEAAAKRIVELSKERQVIVFTHRISLLIGLGDCCDKENVKFSEQHIRGALSGKGIPDFADVYHGKIANQLNGLIDRIRETKLMDQDTHEYMDSCSRISQQLRICVERSVEDVLFQQMVKRFSRRIMTGKLLKMDRITSDDCRIIDYMMTKYSYDEHSQPEDSGIITMNLDEVIADIRNFVSWIKEYTKKIEA